MVDRSCSSNIDSARSTLILDMNHTGLGTLDEFSLMVLFGNYHSQYLTEGLSHNASQIVDVKNNVLYPAYFMTHMRVPPSVPLHSFSLWDQISIETKVCRYGDTILDSTYSAGRMEDQVTPCITMQANSVFILDPAITRTRYKQVSAPRLGGVRDMERLKVPPQALQESARVRACGFDGAERLQLAAEPYRYTLEFNRDTAPGRPLIFAKIPLLMELSEREFLRGLTRSRISEEILQAVSLLERKTFYYGNAFSGNELLLYTKGAIENCSESLWKENPKQQYVYRLTYETELYDNGDLLAISRSDKAIVYEISSQPLIQDTKRLLKPTASGAGINHERYV